MIFSYGAFDLVKGLHLGDVVADNRSRRIRIAIMNVLNNRALDVHFDDGALAYRKHSPIYKFTNLHIPSKLGLNALLMND